MPRSRSSGGSSRSCSPISYADSYLQSTGDKVVFWDETEGISASDGTLEGTHSLGKPVLAVDDNFYDQTMALIDGVLYFDGRTYDEEFNLSGPAMWRTDGTTDGTYAVTGVYGNGLVDFPTAVGQSMYFVNRINKGAELSRYVP